MALLNWLAKVTQAQAIRSRILNDPYYRFQSLEEVHLAASLGVFIDVNRAGVDDWLRLPGLSIHQARTLTELTQAGIALHALDDVAAAIAVPLQRLKPLEPVLRFYYYANDSVEMIQLVNVNTASVEALTRIPGVDLHLARAIVFHRRPGPYQTLAQLQQRLALPADLTTQLMHYLRF
jgi:DNA uptake protein ComE-like DNA-binding protein